MANLTRRISDLARAYIFNLGARRRERWSRPRIAAYQEQRLRSVIAHARTHSPFYRETYASLSADPSLAELPVLTKRQFRERFDDIVTDRSLKISEVELHAGKADGAYFRGRYKVLTTTGTSGPKAYSVFDRAEWSTLLAALMRRRAMAGLADGPFSRQRVSAVHVYDRHFSSYQVGLATRPARGLRRVQNLAINQDMRIVVKALNDFQPQLLTGLSSVVSDLAQEQIEGRLAIRPDAINCGSEATTADIRERCMQAWGISPFDTYGLTEVGLVATECSERNLHLYEDNVIVEPVDDDYRPVEPGVTSSRILVSCLFKFVQPVIRYEVDDLVTASCEDCACGRTFSILESIAGRSNEMMLLPAAGGGVVKVSPIKLAAMLKMVPEILQYQVVSHSPLRLRVVLRDGFEAADIMPHVRAALSTVLEGTRTAPDLDVQLEPVARIERGVSGKIERLARS